MSKIVVVLQSLFGGGAEKQLRLFSEKKFSHPPYFVFLGEPDAQSIEYLDKQAYGYEFISTKSVLRSLPQLYFRLCILRPDIIYSGVLNVNFGLALLKQFFPFRRTIFMVRESGMLTMYSYGIYNQFIRFLYQNLYAKLDLIITQSETQTSDIKTIIPNGKFKICPNLIDLEINFADIKTIRVASRKVVNFVWVGRFCDEKNPELAIEIISEIRKHNFYCTLNFFGGGSLLDRCEGLVNEMNLSDRVFFNGHVNDPFASFTSEDILLLTSRHDAYPNVVLEAEQVPMRTFSVRHVGSISEMAAISQNIHLISNEPKTAAQDIVAELPKFCELKFPSNLLLHHQRSAESKIEMELN